MTGASPLHLPFFSVHHQDSLSVPEECYRQLLQSAQIECMFFFLLGASELYDPPFLFSPFSFPFLAQQFPCHTLPSSSLFRNVGCILPFIYLRRKPSSLPSPPPPPRIDRVIEASVPPSRMVLQYGCLFARTRQIISFFLPPLVVEWAYTIG